jgi:hypothetical protein
LARVSAPIHIPKIDVFQRFSPGKRNADSKNRRRIRRVALLLAMGTAALTACTSPAELDRCFHHPELQSTACKV